MKFAIRWLVLIGLLAAPLACKKQDATASAGPGDYYDYAESGGDGGGYYYAEGAAATGMGSMQPEREVSADFKSSEAPPPAPDQAKLEPIGGKIGGEFDGKDDEPGSDDDESDEPDHGRHMVYTATLQLAVYELDEVIEFAENIPERYGGWVQARYDYQITLRVPAARLGEVMTELATLGVVLGKTLQASDVTAEYTDLESRIAVLEQMQEQLERLLAAAKTVEDSLKVRQELERVRIELESAKTRFRQLAELVGYSTLTLHLSKRGTDEALPSSNDPFPWVDELGVEATEYL
jgi:hypothetical protein